MRAFPSKFRPRCSLSGHGLDLGGLQFERRESGPGCLGQDETRGAMDKGKRWKAEPWTRARWTAEPWTRARWIRRSHGLRARWKAEPMDKGKMDGGAMDKGKMDGPQMIIVRDRAVAGRQGRRRSRTLGAHPMVRSIGSTRWRPGCFTGSTCRSWPS